MAASLLATVLVAGCALEGGPGPSTAPAVIRITGAGSTGELRMERIELTFDNGRPDITVEEGAPLSARARLRFGGTGTFRGQWRVDGRVVDVVNQIVSFGNLMEVPLRAGALPTFQPGRHQVTLEILDPQSAPQSPVIRYFVRVAEPEPAASAPSEPSEAVPTESAPATAEPAP